MRKVIYYFRDNNNNIAQTSINLSDVISFSQAEVMALALAEVLQNISTALLERFEIRSNVDTSNLSVSSPNSNVYDRAILLFTDENSSGSFVIPSVDGNLYDDTGDYAEIRTIVDGTSISPFRDVAQLLVNNAEYPTGQIVSGSVVFVGRLITVN